MLQRRIAKQALFSKQVLSSAATQQRQFNSYEGYKRVTLIPGDGLGPEVMAAIVDLFRIAKVPVRWDTHLVKGNFIDISIASKQVDHATKQGEEGTTTRPKALTWDPEIHAPEVHQSIINNKVVLKGPFLANIGKGVTSVDKMLALKYDLFGHVTIIKTPPIPKQLRASCIFQDLDFVIIKEQTEAEYSGLEHEVIPGVVESLKVVTEEKSMRIAEYAFKYAQATGRKKVIAVHKANIMKLSDGLFLKCCKEMAERYTSAGIEFKDVIVDNMAMQLITKPQQFNDCVIVTTNLYGSIIANTAAALIGGAGVVPGFSASSQGACTVFEQGTRHLGVDIANRNMANPTGMIKSAIYMLHHLGLTPYANQISQAVHKTMASGKYLTPDLGSNFTASTSEFLQAIINNLEAPNFASTQPPSEKILIKV